MKKLASIIVLIPLVLGLIATGCEIEIGDDTDKIATWVGWPDGARDEQDSSKIVFTFTKEVTGLKASNITIDAEGASGHAMTYGEARPVNPTVESPNTATIWEVGLNQFSLLKGLAKVSIDHSDVEKLVHGVPIFEEADRVGYDVTKYPDDTTSTTTAIKLNFKDSWTYSDDLGDDLIPTTADITLTGDAMMTGDISIDGDVVTIPIAATAQNGTVTVWIEKAGIARTNDGHWSLGDWYPDINNTVPYPSSIGYEVFTTNGTTTSINKHFVSGLRKAKTNWTAAAGPDASDGSTEEILFTFAVPVENPPYPSVSQNNDVSTGTWTAREGGKVWALGVVNTGTSAASVTVSFSSTNNEVAESSTSNSVSIKPGKISWSVASDSGNGGTTTKLTFTFGKEVTLNASNITVSGGTKGSLTGSSSSYELGYTPADQGTITVTLADIGNLKSNTASVQVWKYVAPPPPPPAETDPFKMNYPIAINTTGKVLQIEVYKDGGGSGLFPYGDSTAQDVINHRDRYEVAISSIGKDEWKAITTKPQVAATGMLGSKPNVYWPITASARNGMGNIKVRIRAMKTDLQTFGAWREFDNNAKGY